MLNMEARVQCWIETRLGPGADHPMERASRLLEESAELAQVEGITREEAHRQIDHVYDRPAGDQKEEAGGVAVCLLGWCATRGVTFSEIALAEIERIEAKPASEIRASLERKQSAGLLKYERRQHQPFEYDPLDSDPRQNEICRLNGVIENQKKALAHWRREADRDYGKITRYEAALRRISELPASTAEAHTAADMAVEIAKEALP